MKTSKLQKFAGVFFALALATSTLFAQELKSTNGAYVQKNVRITCTDYLSGLTDEQVEAITKLETKHRKQMDELRDKRRATINWDEKALIREEMLENVVAHRGNVRKLLTEEQQKEYDMLQLRGNNFRNQRAGCGYGYGRGYQRGFRGAGYGRGYNQNFRYCPRFN